jgi:formylglycine-generating enzyme required for sulfatase activity
MSRNHAEIARLKDEIEKLRAVRDLLGKDVVDPKIAALEEQLRPLVDTDGGAFLVGDVDTQGGDFIGRDKIINNIYQGAYHGLAPRTDEEAHEIYMGMIMDRCGVLPLQGFTDQTSDATTGRARLSLPGVYIQLSTTFTASAEKIEKYIKAGNLPSLSELSLSGEERDPAGMGREMHEHQNLTALDAAVLSRRLVLLGDPGSGKTTFVNFLAYCIAAGNWDALHNWRESEGDLVPVLVTLRDFAYWLSSADEKDAQGPHALWTYILHDLKLRNLEFAAPLLERAIQQGRALILLDGLDEVPPSAEARGRVLQIVEEFSRRYKDSRYLVTCRVLSYDDPQWRLEAREFPWLTIAPFNETQINDFIHAWHSEIAVKWNQPRRELDVLENKLRGEVARREDLRRLAPNPLLLTVMALVHTSDGELPEARAMLYERAVDILLWRWDQQKGKAQGEESRMVVKLREAGRDRGDLLVRLAKLAFAAHQQVKADGDQDEVTGIPEADLLRELRELHPKRSLDWAEEVVDVMKMRAGLLLERAGGVFSFPHRTFQEYLAGMHLARQTNFTAEALKCIEAGDFWRIVVLLAVGNLVHSSVPDYEKPTWLAEELCPPEKRGDDTAWRRAWLAGEVLLEMGLNRAGDTERGRNLLERVRQRLADLLEAGALTPRERWNAGDVLGALGDPRFDEECFSLPSRFRGGAEPVLGFVHVPAGEFIMGSDDKDRGAGSDEKPSHPLRLPEFYMARYPVTNAQYRHFVEDSGYEQERFWIPEGWAWRNGADFDLSSIEDKDLRQAYQNILRERPAEKRNQPFWWNNPQWCGRSRPVVGVCWYEALAYAAWLNERLRADAEAVISSVAHDPQVREFWRGLAEGNLRIAIPTEAQWEKSARWHPSPSGRGRGEGVSSIYPWGNEWREDHANTSEADLKTTSAVGAFPQGASDLGLLDLSGNVWEWTASKWSKNDPYNPEYKYPYTMNDDRNNLSDVYLRTLRGGSWIYDLRNARCANRIRSLPDDFNYDVGFRLVVSLAGSEY